MDTRPAAGRPRDRSDRRPRHGLAPRASPRCRSTMRSAMRSPRRQVSTIYNPFSPQQYHVVMEVAPEFWQNPEVLKQLYVSTSGRRRQRHAGDAGGGRHTSSLTSGQQRTSASSVAEDVARNLAANSLANAGRGNTSTGSAVSVAARARRAVLGLQPFRHQHHADQREPHRHLGLDLDRLQSARRRVARVPRSRRSSGRWTRSTCRSAFAAAPTARRSCSSKGQQRCR